MTLRDDLAKVQTYAFLTIDSNGHAMSHRVSPWHRTSQGLGYPRGSLDHIIKAVGASFVVRFKAYRPEYIARMDEAPVLGERNWL